MLRDVLGEALGSVRGRLARSWLTVVGVAVAVMALTSTTCVAATVAAQVSSRFDALQARTVTIDGFHRDDDPAGLARLRSLHGVIDSGLMTSVQGEPPVVSQVRALVDVTGRTTSLVALTPGAMRALRVTTTQGRMFDDGLAQRRADVALVGELAATSLGITSIDGRTAITVQGRAYTVLGIVRSDSDVVSVSVIVPDHVVDDPSSGLTFGDPEVVVHTALGAARQVGAEAPVALDPRDPGSLAVAVPPDPRELRRAVETDTRNLFLVLALVSVAVAALGVGNTMLVAVLERRREIGVRRALGATRPAITAQILVESALLGGLGGVAGTLAGVDATFALALAQGWTAALPAWVPGAGPGVGVGIGLLAGLYPAVRAVRIEPIEALQ